LIRLFLQDSLAGLVLFVGSAATERSNHVHTLLPWWHGQRFGVIGTRSRGCLWFHGCWQVLRELFVGRGFEKSVQYGSCFLLRVDVWWRETRMPVQSWRITYHTLS
jgi:hypothetical protein